MRHRHACRRLHALLLVFVLAAAFPAVAQDAPAPAAPGRVAPDVEGAPAAAAVAALGDATGADVVALDARRALAVLEEEARRAELVATLRAISGTATADTAAADAPTGAEPAAVVVPLEEDGLIAQALDLVSGWASRVRAQVEEARDGAARMPGGLSDALATNDGRRLAMNAALALVLVFAVGLALEWALRRALRRPRAAVARHAAEAEQRARERDALRAAAVPATAAPDQAGIEASAAARPNTEGVALVHSMREGVELVEAVHVGTANAAAPPPSPTTTRAAATAAEADDHHARRHLQALRHLPYALGALVLDLLPLILFAAGAAVALHCMDRSDPRLHMLSGAFLQAYIGTRGTMAVVRLLLTPAGYGFCVVGDSAGSRGIAFRWIRRIVVVAAFGGALAAAVQVIGGDPGARLALLKLVSLVVHLLVVVLVFRIRRPVSRAIAAPDGASGAVAAIRDWLADAWPWLASALVLGVWVVWALGVEQGFPKLLRFLAVTGLVLVAGRLAAILALGGLGRVFSADTAADDTADEAATRAAHPAARYYALASRAVSIAITLATGLALLEAWGVEALDWFAAGTVGRALVSALATILVAVAVAVLVWRLANTAVEHRVAGWESAGEHVRAARLRTLMPMLRTVLGIVIGIVVGLTALSQIGINTTPLLAGASIFGVALGFGSQKLVQDFITGIFLLMENAMQVGDFVTVADVSGTVEYLSIRTVRVRSGDGSLHIVPFSSVTTVNNINRGIGNASVRIGIAYGADVDAAIAALKDIGAGLRADPAFRDLVLADLEVWGVDAVDGSTVTLAGQMRCIDRGRWGVQREINRRILLRFGELGIPIADPRARRLVASEAPATE